MIFIPNIVLYITTFSKDFYSKTTGPISIKFHMQPLHREGKKVCIFRPGHMTKMAATPIYNKNLKKSSSLELLG